MLGCFVVGLSFPIACCDQANTLVSATRGCLLVAECDLLCALSLYVRGFCCAAFFGVCECDMEI